MTLTVKQSKGSQIMLIATRHNTKTAKTFPLPRYDIHDAIAEGKGYVQRGYDVEIFEPVESE